MAQSLSLPLSHSYFSGGGAAECLSSSVPSSRILRQGRVVMSIFYLCPSFWKTYMGIHRDAGG
jgi:hypothetical protein